MSGQLSTRVPPAPGWRGKAAVLGGPRGWPCDSRAGPPRPGLPDTGPTQTQADTQGDGRGRDFIDAVHSELRAVKCGWQRAPNCPTPS